MSILGIYIAGFFLALYIVTLGEYKTLGQFQKIITFAEGSTVLSFDFRFLILLLFILTLLKILKTFVSFLALRDETSAREIR